MAGNEALHTFHERLLGAGGEDDHPHPLRRAFGQSVGQSGERRHRAQVVVCAGHHRPGADVGHGGSRAGGQEAAQAAQCAQAGQAPERQQHGAEEHREENGEALVRLGVKAGHALHGHPGQGGMEHETGVGGVVVGDEHHRALGVAIAQLGHHVVRGSRGEGAAAKPKAPAAHVVVDGGRGDRSGERREAAPSGRGRGQGGGVQQPQGPPVAAVGAFGLDAHVARAGSLELDLQPLGRAPLPLVRGGPLVGRELSYHPLDQGAALGHGSLPALNASPIPMRCAVVGWVPNRSWVRPGGSGSEMLRSASRRSS